MKKLNKLLAMITALAVMAMMCAVSAFAADYADEVGPLSLSKTLTMPEGTTTPDVTYTFEFTQDTESAQSTAVPIEDVELTFSATDTGATAEGTKTVTKTWMDILDGYDFTKPGLYVYYVTEKAGAATDSEGKYTGHYEYSQAEYKLSVLVDKDGNVTGVAAQQTKDDEGEDIETEEKVDPTVPDGQEDEDGDNVGDETDISADGHVNFNNNYYKTVANDPTGTDADEDEDEDGTDDNDGDSLYVEKFINVDEDYLDEDKEFTFTITVAFPANSDTATYTASVVDAAGGAVSPAQTLTFSRADEDSLEQTFTLRHGDRLVFTAIDIGATYTVTEAEDEDGDYTYVSGAVEEDAIVTDSADNGTQIVNTYDYSTDTPTGILINNLPYIALALVAIGGLVAYVVVRRKNEDEA